MLSLPPCEALASALEYPRPTTAAAARAGVEAIVTNHPQVAAGLTALADEIDSKGVRAAEERYTLLFDLKPVCTLNLSWHIFGDTYDRGALLAQLVFELRKYGVAYEHDLPDHLPTLLRLLGSLDDEEDQQLLVHAVMLPGLKKIQRTLKESKDPWALILSGLAEFLDKEVPKNGRTDIPTPKRPLEMVPQ